MLKNPSPVTFIPQGFRLAVRVTPKAAQNKVRDVFIASDGKAYLKCSVTAPPEDGKANEALIQLLSKHLHLPKSSIKIISGEASRTKILELTVDEKEHEAILSKLGLIVLL